jgi:4-amino-4-deoxy-L-arabinose transferase-like glycosyltransferase
MERASRRPPQGGAGRTPAELAERTRPAETGETPSPTEEMRPLDGRASVRRPRPRLPTAAWVCFTVALLNGIAWGLIIPLFQTPDEPGHVAYVQYVAETGKPPTGRSGVSHFSAEQRSLLDALLWKQIQRRKDNRVPGTATYLKNLERDVDAVADRVGGGGYTTDTNNPPLYYYGAAAIYDLSPWSALPDRVHLLRLFSALLAAVTVLFVFLFVRELLPSTPWAWTVGALAVAFQPMFGFTSSGVTSETVLYAASAGIFYLFALAFRRGLTVNRGAAIGALAAIGLLSKTNMLGLAPGIAFGLLVLVLTADRDRRRQAVRGALAALVVVAVPALIYMALNSTVWDRDLWFGREGVPPVKDIPVPGSGSGSGSGAGSASGAATETESATLLDGISYMWQFYLPRLPFMDSYFPDYQLRNLWFDGFIGEFGWLEFGFPQWVYNWSLALAFGLLALVARQLVTLRNVLRSRLWELITYLGLMFGVLVLIAGTGYVARLGGSPTYEQPRYLFPLLALYGALIALAARGAGKRYGPAVGVLLVCIAIAHTAAAMLLTLTRYYG